MGALQCVLCRRPWAREPCRRRRGGAGRAGRIALGGVGASDAARVIRRELERGRRGVVAGCVQPGADMAAEEGLQQPERGTPWLSDFAGGFWAGLEPMFLLTFLIATLGALCFMCVLPARGSESVRPALSSSCSRRQPLRSCRSSRAKCHHPSAKVQIL